MPASPSRRTRFPFYSNTWLRFLHRDRNPGSIVIQLSSNLRTAPLVRTGRHMDYFRRFTFLFAAPVFDADDLEGVRFNQIIDEIHRSGFEVVRARKIEDAEIAVQTDAAI